MTNSHLILIIDNMKVQLQRNADIVLKIYLKVHKRYNSLRTSPRGTIEPDSMNLYSVKLSLKAV